MDNQILDDVIAIQVNGATLIPLKADITKLFGTNKAIFQVSIKDNKIIIESPKILADLDIQDKPLVQEAINVN